MKRERPEALHLMIVCCIEQLCEEKTALPAEVEFFDALQTLITTRYKASPSPRNWQVANRIAKELFSI